MSLKLKRFISVLIVAAIAAAMIPGAALASTTPGAWFSNEFPEASASGLLTANAAKNFSRKLTRDEFCEIVVLLTEKIIGRELALPSANPFTDTNSEYVQKAYLYGKTSFGTGIVNGTSNTTFSPNDPVSRQQIAAMMIRAYKQMEIDTRRTLLDPPLPDLAFKDKAKINDYAVEPVKSAVANGMFYGDDVNNFNPLNDISAEECVAVVLRSYDKSQNKINSGLSNAALLDKATENLEIGYAYGDIQSGVSRNVILPASALGGATVTWYSSSPSVIDAYGNVTSGNREVTLTATVRLANATKTKSFILTTTTLTGDSLIMANARAALELGFRNPDDNIDRVTDDVFLPNTVLGLPVTWRTNNASVVTDKGLVSVPNNSTELTATLTASFGTGSQSGTKAFTLRVRNANYVTSEVYLHNIKLGMTLTEVTNTLQTSPKTSVSLASGESWSLYYSLATSSSNYTTNSIQNFIAVAVKSNKVIGIYTMVDGWQNYLRDGLTTSAKKLTSTEVNRNADIALETYDDSRSNSSAYAAFLYDINSTAGQDRTLTVAGFESFLFELINAYRGINGYLPLTTDTKLATSARSHSADLIKYDRFDDAGSTANNTYAKRAIAAGFSGSVSGMISNNETNPFDYLDDLIETAAYRTAILSTGVNVVGIGASTGAKATNYYTDIVTAVFGVGTVFSFDYANYIVGVNQDITVRAATNNSVLTSLSYKSGTTANATVVAASGIVTGKKAGATVITATAKDSSNTTLTATTTVTVEPMFTVTSAKDLSQLDTATNKTAQLVIGNPNVANPYGITYTYTSSNPAVATVGANTGLITAVTGGSTVITVRMTRSGYGGYVQAAPVNVTVRQGDSITINGASTQNLQLGSTLQLTATKNPTTAVVTWSSLNTAVATVSNSGLVTPVSVGQAIIEAEIPIANSGFLKASVTINVTDVTPTISIAATSATNIAPGGQVSFIATIGPNQYAIDQASSTIIWDNTGGGAGITFLSTGVGLGITVVADNSFTVETIVKITATITYNGEIKSNEVEILITPTAP
ncbi:MAG: Ig-like domain-containing protein [Oscillospiraceae bacterium]|jgi:uncharacterized protein YkwD|nr:Ig-like domain-containing protein [Oscillospiraceae bacterium]